MCLGQTDVLDQVQISLVEGNLSQCSRSFIAISPLESMQLVLISTVMGSGVPRAPTQFLTLVSSSGKKYIGLVWWPGVHDVFGKEFSNTGNLSITVVL
jgi:hypothetical protein